jgi:aromatic-L-amino-acid/L-tryptophan decarboxylase
VAARTRYTTLYPHVPMSKLTLYTTTQTHSLGAKAALVLGLKVRALEVDASNEYGLRGDELGRALEEDGNGEGVFAIGL